MIKHLRWLLVSLLFIGGAISYLDRAALSVAAPLIARELHLSPAQLGVVFSSFFFGYALFCFVGGFAADRIGPKNVFSISMTVWSVFCGLTAAVISLSSLLLVRVVFGMGEGPFSATANKFVSNWFPRREQASAVGLANAGQPLGAALAGPMVGFIAVAAGWRASFVLVAGIGLLWTLGWLFLAADTPDRHPWKTHAHIKGSADDSYMQAGDGHALWTYLTRPSIIATAFAFFGYAYILYFFLSWFPSYLTMAQHLTIKRMGIVSAIPWLLGFVGLATSGFVSDAVFNWTGHAVQARKLVLVVGLLIAAGCVAGAGVATGVGAVVTLMALSVFCMYLTATSYWAIVLDTIEPQRVGAVSGFVHLIANLAGIVAPSVTGLIIQFTGSFVSAFVLAGLIAVMGALAVLVFVRPREELIGRKRRPSRTPFAQTTSRGAGA